MKGFSFKIALLMTLVGLIQVVHAAGEPQVRFLEPAAGNSGPDLGVVVDASDADGKVREVNLYINNTLVRRERAKPYEWGTANTNSDDPALLNLTPGSYQLRAVAKDDQGKIASVTRTITVLGANTNPTVSAKAVQNGSNTLNRDESLGINQYLGSSNGTYRFNFQGDGNLVLRDQATGAALWSSKTNGQNASRLTMQGDGNLVLYTSTNSAVWDSGTNGKGAVRAVMQNDGNFVLYSESNAPVWSTNTAQGTDTGGNTGGGTGTDGGTDTGVGSGSNDGGGSGGGTADSTGQFSAPSAALFSLNDSRQLGVSKYIDTGFGGNGHAETWDGRVFVRTRTSGWEASAFRPERVTRNSDGSVNFKNGAFGNSISLERKDEATDMQHNWIALVKDPSVSGENPYPSNSSGSYSVNGTYATYKAMVIHTSKRNGDNDQMGQRRATFIVQNSNTPNAQLVRADFTSSFQKYRLQSGSDFRCIEPSATVDGRLIVCQGHPDNNGRIDNLVYSWNPTPGATSNWRAPKSIANMYFDDRNTNVAGIPFYIRFPIAEKPLLDATGNDFNRNELVKGAYPWISHDGSELFYQASRDGVDARRTGTTVVGRWTGWTFRYIDGPINKNRHETAAFPTSGKRLFISSPGAFTTMWAPYKDVDNLKIPYSVRGPSYPIFGSNSQDYSEVGFDDYLDGNFVLYYGMNEQLTRDGTYLKNRTNDTSGNFNNGTLNGARFPLEYNGRDEIVGRHGQAIYFNGGNYISVNKNKGWNTLVEGVSVDFWVKKQGGSGTIRLFNMQGGLEVYLSNGNNVNAAISDTSGRRVTINGGSVSSNNWSHVAFTFDPKDKQMKLYVNGNQVAAKAANGFGTLSTSGAVTLGPQDSSGLLLLDEVKVSNVARRAYEVKHYANVRSNVGPNQALANSIPEHLRRLRFNTTGVDRYSSSAADLGQDLFNDPLLSKEMTTSCSTCHDAVSAFTDGLDIARGNEPTDAGVRNTPTLLNRLFSSLQGWSGIDGSLDQQALTPIQAQHEMNLPITEAVQRVSTAYGPRFQQVYGEAPNADNIAAALASFQATQFAPRNRVDEFKAGNTSVLSVSERRGLELFENKARCSGCHAGANFTDESFRNNGLAMNDDIGRADVTGRDRDHKLFKVPSLRELGLTGPYMHDGSISSLQEVVQAYNTGAVNVATRDTDMRPLELSSQEVNDVVAFLGALSENGASGGNTGGNTNVSEVSRVKGLLVGGAGSTKPGFTLYVFDNDMGSSGSNCNGACVNAWPPVLVEDSAASGVAGLSTITRSDGSKQAAYNGRPLYFFANDSSASDTKGDGANGVWWIADDANSSGGGNMGGMGEGSITRQVWTGVSGTGLASLTSLPNYPNYPNSTNQLTSFEAQSNWADNYGTRIAGYLHAPVSGAYTFWIATDDNGELWLSTNDSASNKQKIASISNWAGVRNWTKFPSQKSASINLQAGQRYYIEALQKEGGGGDNIAVAWQRPGGSLEVIPGDYLSPYTDNTPSPAIYTLTVNNGSGDNKYASGTKISIKADTAPSGKLFDRWLANSGSPVIANVTASTTTLTMPARAVTVTASYKTEPTSSGGPAGYAKCTNEGGSCTFSQRVDVAYGANGKFAYKTNVSGTITFNNANFGDPIPGIAKAGYSKVVGSIEPKTESATFEKRITSSADDAEEQSNGSVNTTSTDLELVFDNSNQTVGMRFTSVSIPQGAEITRAYIQFTTDETNSGTTSVRIKAHDIDDAPAFSTSSNNISSRATTNASSLWTPSAWNTVGQSASNQRTPPLTRIVQEVVSRNGWKAGNDMAFIITGTGERTAESYDGSSTQAPMLHVEYTYTTDSGNTGGDNGGDTGGTAELSHVGSTSDYSASGDVQLNVPSGTREGDLMLAFVMRTDDILPIKWNGWTAGASCYKSTNGQNECHEIRHCSRPDGDYCLAFNGGNGRDLATVVFYKTAAGNEPTSHRFNLRNSHAGWGIMTTLRGADNNNPFRDVATESNDGDADSRYPSVNGLAGDMLLLSMSFDDTTKRDDFRAPNGMEMFQWVAGVDEAGYVYGQKLTRDGATGVKETIGNGGSNAKDALISMTIRPGTANNGGNTGGGDTGGGDTGGNAGGDAKSSNNWLSDTTIMANEFIESANGQYRLYFQGDGNAVLRNVATGNALWSSGTNGKGGTRLSMQSDGNLVIYTFNGSPVWASGTNGTGADRLVINNDGSLAIYAGDNPVWSQNGTGNTGSGDTSGNTGDGTGSSVDGVKIAFIGDTGAGGNFQNVLNLIKAEGAELTIVAGDTSYDSSRDDDWDKMVRDTLGSSDPALVVAGNHDYGDSNFGNVRSFGQSRLNRQSGVQCSGAYAEKMTCNYKGIYFVMSAIGASGSRSDHESFISNSLNNAPDGAWRVCAWHKNQRDMQVGGKTDETGWTAYEACRQKGAIISTGHEHSYSRTHLLSDMSSKSVSTKSSTFTVSEGKTFAFVSGLGGVGIRDQERGGDWWAKIYTSTQGARYGAMFGTFYEDRAEFYFKNINGQIIDQFTVMKGY